MKRRKHAAGKVCVYSSINGSGKACVTLTAYSWSRAANLLLKSQGWQTDPQRKLPHQTGRFPTRLGWQTTHTPLLAKVTNELTSHSIMELQCLLSLPVKVHCTVMGGFNNLTHHQTNQFFYVQVKIVMPITETEWHDHPLWMISYALRQGGVTEYTFWWWKCV